MRRRANRKRMAELFAPLSQTTAVVARMERSEIRGYESTKSNRGSHFLGVEDQQVGAATGEFRHVGTGRLAFRASECRLDVGCAVEGENGDEMDSGRSSGGADRPLARTSSSLEVSWRAEYGSRHSICRRPQHPWAFYTARRFQPFSPPVKRFFVDPHGEEARERPCGLCLRIAARTMQARLWQLGLHPSRRAQCALLRMRR